LSSLFPLLATPNFHCRGTGFWFLFDIQVELMIELVRYGGLLILVF